MNCLLIIFITIKKSKVKCLNICSLQTSAERKHLTQRNINELML